MSSYYDIKAAISSLHRHNDDVIWHPLIPTHAQLLIQMSWNFHHLVLLRDMKEFTEI